MEPTGKALSNAIDGIVILVDYGSLSNCLYSRMVAEIVPAIGYYLAQIISSFYFNLSKVGLVGVGLGAHIAGYAGAALNGGVYRITGMFDLVLLKYFFHEKSIRTRKVLYKLQWIHSRLRPNR